ncbi:L-glyceraldehyde 3-phosphate reductase [Streptomyces gardneri]|uniref:L-glyceraldehyde 3-phosphate reductase n=1 Tax=Streptomyces gardneri TaxID=66892 RepID=UPI0006BCC3DA|nr:L-glyceraldehyde 3-phosphate reductase [Streptomyces gardneri]QPK50171.1 L-glyceraldehyde 3-phosphate reductase [Streptomyces gardneri]WRK41771.1 L-glyceraldehyde 3-phosphate reductase [Streptomyces venezuelae]CUM35665.1 putative ion channel subunit [Streptomyces venezuelae]
MYTAHPARYDDMPYRRSGRSGLKLPALSLGLWHNFGPDRPAQTQRAILRRAFDLGITHFDLANNYGPPPGAAESALGEFLRTDFAPYRDELVVSTKAGYLMWPGPYGEWGSRKSLLSSLDQSLGRLGLDYVDVFYSHRFDPDTPLEETMGALHSAVQQGKALYVGVSNYSAEQTREAARILGELGTPLTIHQPRYSMLDRRPENEGLLDALDDLRVGSIAYSPLEQGLLTGRYLDGIPDDSRAASDSPFLNRDALTEDLVTRLRALNDIAASRGQTLAQLALAWVLRGGRVTSALVGASSTRQLEDSVAALRNLDFDTEELTLVDTLARP